MSFRAPKVKIPMPKSPKVTKVFSRVTSMAARGQNKVKVTKDSSANHNRYDFGKED